MPRARSLTTDLAKLLAATSSPVYAVDDGWRLVYVNRACAEWVGIEAELLLGQVCKYRSADQSTQAATVAGALCPPPEVMAGQRTAGRVACEVDGKLRSRACEFVPLFDVATGVAGALAIVAARDLTGNEGEDAGVTDEDWRAALQLHRSALASRYRPEQLLGVSLAMGRVRRQVQVASQSGSNVSIVGPRGSGRRHIARTIHYGPLGDAAGTLIPLACDTLDRDVLRATWRAARSQGSSSGAALLLQEVDCLAADAQADVARWLRDAEGSIRLLATSQRGLRAMVDAGDFVVELAEGLSTLVIEVPALAARIEDVPWLAQAFVEEINAHGEKQLSGCTPEALDRLASYGWPGNLHELAQVLCDAHERAMGTSITQRDLPDHVRLADELWRDRQAVDEPIVLDEFLVEIERRLLEGAMVRAGGNKTKAAQLLGMSRPRLYRRLVQLGLEDEGTDEETRG